MQLLVFDYMNISGVNTLLQQTSCKCWLLVRRIREKNRLKPIGNVIEINGVKTEIVKGF
jgi:hypothetical protein